MLDKLGGIFAPKPSCGPHAQRESLPLIILLRNRLKYALTGREVHAILSSRFVKIDGKVRTDSTFPAGFMDVVHIEKTDEYFRLLYDAKGRFVAHRITKEEASYKLCKIRKVQVGHTGIPFVGTHDGRTIRFPDPLIRANDTVILDIATGKIKDFIKFEVGSMAMVTGGKNVGRIGIIKHKERHKGSFDIVHIEDASGHSFATRITNVFVLGKADKPLVSLPKGKGVRPTILQEQEQKFGTVF